MKAAIVQRFKTVSRSLGPHVRQKLHAAVPQFRASTHGGRHSEFEIQKALTLARSMSPAAGPAVWDSMVFYLVAVSGMSELDAGQAMSTAKQDSMSGMGDMEAVRFQMALDRMSRVMDTLSNLLKKAGGTSSSSIQNLK